jgi:hypothetical protein
MSSKHINRNSETCMYFSPLQIAFRSMSIMHNKDIGNVQLDNLACISSQSGVCSLSHRSPTQEHNGDGDCSGRASNIVSQQ